MLSFTRFKLEPKGEIALAALEDEYYLLVTGLVTDSLGYRKGYATHFLKHSGNKGTIIDGAISLTEYRKLAEDRKYDIELRKPKITAAQILEQIDGKFISKLMDETWGIPLTVMGNIFPKLRLDKGFAHIDNGIIRDAEGLLEVMKAAGYEIVFKGRASRKATAEQVADEQEAEQEVVMFRPIPEQVAQVIVPETSATDPLVQEPDNVFEAYVNMIRVRPYFSTFFVEGEYGMGEDRVDGHKMFVLRNRIYNIVRNEIFPYYKDRTITCWDCFYSRVMQEFGFTLRALETELAARKNYAKTYNMAVSFDSDEHGYNRMDIICGSNQFLDTAYRIVQEMATEFKEGRNE